MKTSRLLALAAILSAATAGPALADWDNVGSIKVDYNVDRDSKSPDFGGPVESMRFIARGGDVQCRFIRATFANGNTLQIFSGRLAQGAPHAAGLPGNQRNVRRLDFMCRAFSKAGATIQIQADIGRYRDEWRRGPQWNYWSHVFTNWNQAVDSMTSYWVPLGSVRFSRTLDQDGSAGGWAGRSITSLGLKALNGDARCTKLGVRFANGNRVSLRVPNILQQGRLYRVDLPGNQRNVVNVQLRCRTVAAQRAVTVSIFANK